MRVLSAAEMQACDKDTTENFGISSIALMRAASGAVAAFALQQYPRARRVTVLCGRGNNGGDGMMTAQHLAAAGLSVTTLLLGAPERLGPDVATAWSELLASAAPGSVHVIEHAAELTRHDDALRADLLIDAIVGTGFKPPLKGLAAQALDWVTSGSKEHQPPILAIDLPSGWSADSTAATPKGDVFPADAVITFTAPKPAHLFGNLTRSWDQPVVVAPIGSPAEAVASALKLHWAGSSMALPARPRPADSNKGKYGHVLVVGGSIGRSGAPSMTSLSALRTGAGLVTAAVPSAVQALVASIAPELMTTALTTSDAGGIAAECLAPDFIAALIKGISVLAIGPGIGQAPETVKFVTGLLGATRIPAVIDADALNILAAKPVLLEKLAKGRTVVLTPHPGEMARLTGLTIPQIQADRLNIARSFAQRLGLTLVLKGARTLIAHPDGRVAINTTGNPGMAKGGSGDLLTGVVAAMLAQYPDDVAAAVEAAVCLHGRAADLAVRDLNEHTLLATDSLAKFSRAFRFDSTGQNGYVWLQGLPG